MNIFLTVYSFSCLIKKKNEKEIKTLRYLRSSHNFYACTSPPRAALKLAHRYSASRSVTAYPLLKTEIEVTKAIKNVKINGSVLAIDCWSRA
jgi:hypothetical protein